MFDLARRLEQQQAAIGIDRIDASSRGIARDGDEVFFRFIAEEGEPKAALALKGAVAAAAVAAGAAQEAHDVSLEIDFLKFLGAGQIDLRVGGGAEQ